MSRSARVRRGLPVVAVLLSAWVLSAGDTGRSPVPAGRLIAAEPLSLGPAEGDTCLWEPPSRHPITARPGRAFASTQATRVVTEGGSTVDFSTRPPVRQIRDAYSTYSSIAVDPTNNEVVMTDENNFGILVYDRLTNTPPQAKLSEPKRIIGGLKTQVEFNCGLYIDPKNGDIYSVNNDTVHTLTIFSRDARGDVPPTRKIQTPVGKTFGIAVDDVHQELLLSLQFDSAVITFDKMAKDDDAPIRLLQGDRTRLGDPHGMALDSVHDLLFVANYGGTHSVMPANTPGRELHSGEARGKKNWPVGFPFAIPGSGRNDPPSITVYRRTASGDTPPIRAIQGPKTRLNWPTGLAYDPRTDELFVANDMSNNVVVFPGTANGDVAPIRVLQGPQTKLSNPTSVFVDVTNDELWVSNMGNHSGTVYKSNASGDTPPLRVIRSAPEGMPSPGVGNARVAFDTKRDELLVPN